MDKNIVYVFESGSWMLDSLYLKKQEPLYDYEIMTYSELSNTLKSVFFQEPSEQKRENWNLLVGSWFGSMGIEDRSTYSWIIRRNVNGKYRLEGKVTRPDVKKRNVSK